MDKNNLVCSGSYSIILLKYTNLFPEPKHKTYN